MASGVCSPTGGALAGGSAPLSFEPVDPGPSVGSNLTLEWDFDNDGDFDEPEEDITGYVLAAQSITGRDFPSRLTGHAGPGQLKLTLRNDDDRFSDPAGPLQTAPFSLDTGRRVRVRGNDGVTGASAISATGLAAATAGNNASLSPALPSGLVEGDTMIIVAAIRNSGTGTVNTPAGWANMVSSGNVAVLMKVYETGESGPTITFANGAANATTIAHCFSLRGVHPQLSRAVVATATQLNGSAQDIAFPTLTATAKAWLPDPDLVTSIVVGWKQDDWSSAGTVSGFAKFSDTPSTLGDDAGVTIQVRIGGAVGAATVSAGSILITGGGAAISRAIVLQLAPAVAVEEPILLASDSFRRPDSTILGTDDLGNLWTMRSGAGFGTAGGDRAQAIKGHGANYGQAIVSTVDTGTTDHYVQGKMPIRVQDGEVGLVARWLDSNNYVRCFYDVEERRMVVQEVIAGVATNLPNGGSDGFQIEAWDGMTIGLEIRNQRAWAHVGGQRLDFGNLYLSRPAITGTHAGLYGRHEPHSDAPPMSRDFRVYDRVLAPMDGLVGTFWVKSINTNVRAGALKIVEVDCQGPLAGMAGIDVSAPRISRTVGESIGGFNNYSVPAGCIVGDLVGRAGLLKPPFPIEQYPASRLGPVSFKDGKALDLARLVEVAERGFIKETPEGAITFEDRFYRDGISSQAWFSDTAGVGQFYFEEIDPLDHEGQIVNRATAQVAPTCPTVVEVDNQGDDDSSLDVQIIVPDVTPGDLVLAFIACSAQLDDKQWQEPIGWKRHRDVGDQQGIRIYSLIADGTESGTQVYFFKSTVQGTFIAHTYVVRDWYGTDDGIKVGRVSAGAIGGTNAYPVSPGWNRAPALYILFQGAIGAATGILWDDLNTPPPIGYDYLSLNGLVFVTSPVTYETGVESVYKIDVLDSENPGPWENVFDDYLLLESVVVAIRGYNGPLDQGSSFDDSTPKPMDGLVVSVDDHQSQLDRRFIRTNPDVPALLYTEGDARDWCQAVLDENAQDRPIITIGFTASTSAGLRSQAMRRRVGDKITVTANGRAGLGIERDFFIESIHHEWTNGVTRWYTTWELSPA